MFLLLWNQSTDLLSPWKTEVWCLFNKNLHGLIVFPTSGLLKIAMYTDTYCFYPFLKAHLARYHLLAVRKGAMNISMNTSLWYVVCVLRKLRGHIMAVHCAEVATFLPPAYTRVPVSPTPPTHAFWGFERSLPNRCGSWGWGIFKEFCLQCYNRDYGTLKEILSNI